MHAGLTGSCRRWTTFSRSDRFLRVNSVQNVVDAYYAGSTGSCRPWTTCCSVAPTCSACTLTCLSPARCDCGDCPPRISKFFETLAYVLAAAVDASPTGSFIYGSGFGAVPVVTSCRLLCPGGCPAGVRILRHALLGFQ